MNLDADTLDALGYGNAWDAVVDFVRDTILEWRERMRAVRAACKARGEKHPSDVVDDARREARRAADRARYVPHPRPRLSAEEQAARKREKVRERRAAMTAEERRAEWRRHQHARRERLRS